MKSLKSKKLKNQKVKKLSNFKLFESKESYIDYPTIRDLFIHLKYDDDINI
jgi:hypothetical protein